MQTDDDMVSAVEQWLRDNPPLTNLALRSEIEQNRATIAALEASLRAAEEREKALREALKMGHELVASVAKELP